MNTKNYAEYISAETLMGPSSVQILKELLQRHPQTFAAEQTVLDLGCGKGLTSLVLAKETGAKVFANDLWISAEENAQRFADWGVGGQITPVHEDATDLHFEKKQFDALFSVDAYHYFAGEPGFFQSKILPFLNDGAVVCIGVPGMQEKYRGRSEELLGAWLGDEAYMFKSPSHWKELLGSDDRIETVETWEMDCFSDAWNEWFATGHEFALGDQRFYADLIEPYSCFVGMYIKLK